MSPITSNNTSFNEDIIEEENEEKDGTSKQMRHEFTQIYYISRK